MRKFQLDTSIMNDINAVKSDSFKDNIKMIEIDKLKPSLDNFYSMSEIEILAEDIERQGLKHNLVVTEDADNLETYFIKSGHRRYAAIKYLVAEKRYTSKYVPCLVDGKKTHNENFLDLIMLNATTRVMDDSELYHQYEALRDLLKQMECEGMKIKGRLREKIASLLNVSPAQVGKIENIKHNAIPEIQDAVEQGTVSIAAADKIAKLPENQQHEIASSDLSEVKASDIPKVNKEKKEQKKASSEEALPSNNEDTYEEETDDEDELSDSTSEPEFISDPETKVGTSLSEIPESLIKEYLIGAAEKANFNQEQINQLIGGLMLFLNQ